MSQSQSEGSLLAEIANYTEILAKNPKSKVFVSLAEAYRRMGLLDEAYSVASKGIRALPKYGPGYTVMGRVYAQRGDGFAATASFERALAIEPESLPAFKGLVKVLVKDGEKEKALEVLQKAVRIYPDDTGLQKVLLSLRPAAPPPKTPPPQSIPSLERRQRTPSSRPKAEIIDPITTATIADIYIRQGFPQRAMKVYRDLLKADPHNVEIRQKLVALKQELEAQAEEERYAEQPAVAAMPELAGQVPELETTSMAEPSAVVDQEILEPAVTEMPIVPPEEDPKSGRMRHLEILNRWLEAIRLRREYV